MKNTALTMLFRTEDDKVWHDLVIKGEMTIEQRDAIAKKLHDGEFIIADQVGLPNLADMDGSIDTDDLHPYTLVEQFEDERMGPEDWLTDEEPNHDMTVEQLVAAFDRVKEWDEIAEMERLGLNPMSITP